jgi:hypothetical protein
MAVNTYDKGDTIRLWAYFKVSSVYTDPTAIALKVKSAAGVTTTYTYALGTVTKSTTGIYYKDVSLTDDGIWYYRFEGTGTVAAAAEGKFEVRRSEF